MTTEEIKKALYKERPIANFLFIRKGIATYRTQLTSGQSIHFDIPVFDMGDADFLPVMDAKLLNRWIVNNEQY
jgi:predicted PolB exonuclease-like 3'-5' exonuclease